MKSIFMAVCGWALLVVSPLTHATPNPTSVTVTGSLQSELGCPADYDPGCAATHMTYSASSDVWRTSGALPMGSYDYLAVLNDSFGEYYGAHAVAAGAQIGLNIPVASTVNFYYDHKTHWIADSVNSVIATFAGDFQSELGCPGDWDPSCMRSWLEDPDGDGIYSFSASLPNGSYSGKVTINESFVENYGADGIFNGANINFQVLDARPVLFQYCSSSHVLAIGQSAIPCNTTNQVPEPASLAFASLAFALTLSLRTRKRMIMRHVV